MQIYSSALIKSMGFLPNKSENSNPMRFWSQNCCDTVSFSARAKMPKKGMKNAPSELTCSMVSDNAEPARYYLEKVLSKYLQPLVSANMSDNKPIEKYITRRKSPSSIREKAVTKSSNKAKKEFDIFANQVCDEMMQYYELNKNYDKDSLLACIKQSMYDVSNDTSYPPYDTPMTYLIAIMEAVEMFGIFDNYPTDPKDNKCIFLEILGALKSSASENTYYDPQSVEGIKHYVKDIVGARILLKNPESAGLVIDALKNAAKDGALKITSIENSVPTTQYMPAGRKISDYAYVSDSKLKSLARTAGAELIKNESQTGYLALHINVDLSNPLFDSDNGVFNNYSGEIQIIGKDVEQLKEVEDLCYKLKDNKYSMNPKYNDFKKYFLKYYNTADKEAFDAYTYTLYLFQRLLSGNSEYNPVFPSIEELGFEGIVPEELDYNNLKKKKLLCDLKDIAAEQAKTIISLADKSTSEGRKKQNDAIKNMKSKINYTLN